MLACPKAFAELPRADLAAAMRDYLAVHGSLRVEARGRSMAPTIPDGSMVDVEALLGAPVIDELLCFVASHALALVVHRVIAVREDGAVLTHGDGLKNHDGWSEPAYHIGVVRRYRLGGRVYHARPGAPRARPSGRRQLIQRAARALRRLSR